MVDELLFSQHSLRFYLVIPLIQLKPDRFESAMDRLRLVKTKTNLRFIKIRQFHAINHSLTHGEFHYLYGLPNISIGDILLIVCKKINLLTIL